MKRILLIVGGGIAAYKACALIRLARKAGIDVKCVLTASGAQFITPMTLAALSERQVHTSLWDLKWAGMLGFGFFIEAMTLSTALRLAPMWLAALLMGFTLFGWAAWKDGTGIRALATFALYAALIGLFGRVDTFYWGLMVAPAILIGLAFAPDGLTDLFVAAFPRRRKITVTRITP